MRGTDLTVTGNIFQLEKINFSALDAGTTTPSPNGYDVPNLTTGKSAIGYGVDKLENVISQLEKKSFRILKLFSTWN